MILAQPDRLCSRIITDPQLQPQRRAQGNEAVEDNVVADDPWDAAENDRGSGKSREKLPSAGDIKNDVAGL